jgi:hypothetical protein
LNNTKERKRVTYTDPRARRLVVNAFVALGAIGLLTLLLCSYMVTAGGEMNIVGYSAITLILALAVGGGSCLVLAPRVESRYAADLATAAEMAAEAADQMAVTETPVPATVGPSRDPFTVVDMPAEAPKLPARPATPEPAPAVVVATPEPVSTAPAVVQH